MRDKDKSAGAGFFGTDDLLNKYKRDTPGESMYKKSINASTKTKKEDLDMKSAKEFLNDMFNEEVELDEAVKAAKNAGPFTVVAIKNGKVIDTFRGAEHNELKDVVAFVKANNKGAKISVEAKGGKIVHTEDVEVDEGKVKLNLNPKKKIGYEIRSVGPGGKTTVTKREDMPDKKDINDHAEMTEAKAKRITKLHGEYPKGTHFCATHVEHAEYGIGSTIKSQHASPDRFGDIDWYDVMFEHGIEQGVPTDVMDILLSEVHENHDHEGEDQLDEMKPWDKLGADKKTKSTASYQAYLKKVAGEQAKRGREIEAERKAGTRSRFEEVEMDEAAFDSKKSAEEIRLRTKYRMSKDGGKDGKPYSPEDMHKAMDSLQRKKATTSGKRRLGSGHPSNNPVNLKVGEEVELDERRDTDQSKLIKNFRMAHPRVAASDTTLGIAAKQASRQGTGELSTDMLLMRTFLKKIGIKGMIEDVDLDEATKWKMGGGKPRGGSHIENVRFWDLPKDELNYIIKDAGEAMKANPKAKKATTGRGNWADQVNDAHTVLGWRKKNSIKESAEQVDELKTPTVMSYIKKAQKDNTNRVMRMADKPSHMPVDKDEMAKLKKRQRGIVKAKDDMKRIVGPGNRHTTAEEVEQVDELDIKTLKSYKEKARKDHSVAYHKDRDFDRTEKRKKGFTKASNRIIKNDFKKFMAKDYTEDVENVRKEGVYDRAMKVTDKFNKALDKRTVPFQDKVTKKLNSPAKTKLGKLGQKLFNSVEYKESQVVEAKVGDTVHLGHASKGGSGVKGKVVKIDGRNVHIKNDRGDTFKGPLDRVTVGEAIRFDAGHPDSGISGKVSGKGKRNRKAGGEVRVKYKGHPAYKDDSPGLPIRAREIGRLIKTARRKDTKPHDSKNLTNPTLTRDPNGAGVRGSGLRNVRKSNESHNSVGEATTPDGQAWQNYKNQKKRVAGLKGEPEGRKLTKGQEKHYRQTANAPGVKGPLKNFKMDARSKRARTESVVEGILNKISGMTKEPRVEYSPINGKDAWQVHVWSPKVKKYIPQGSPHKSEKDAKKDAKSFRENLEMGEGHGFEDKRTGNINAKISNRKDLSSDEKEVARKSLRRKSNTTKRKEGGHNVIANAGKRFNVGTNRPVRDEDPKHTELSKGQRMIKNLKSYKSSGGG